MVIAFIDKATATIEGLPTTTVTLPAPALEGDLLIASGHSRGASQDVTRAGWTSLAAVTCFSANDSQAFAYHVAAAGEPAAYEFTYSPTQGRVSIAQFRGIPGAVLDATATAALNNGGPATVNINPTDGPDVLLIASSSLAIGGANQYTPANGETELYDLLCASNFDPCGWFAYRIVSPSTGIYAVGGTLANSAPWAIRAAAFRAGAAAGPSGFFGGLDGGAW